MRFKNFWVTKTDVDEPVLLKSFSDGEHQMLHTLGLPFTHKSSRIYTSTQQVPLA
jgi:hypothetical protein